MFRLLMLHGLEYFGKYYSSYRGFVVDNEDPKGMGRVKIVLPTIYPQDVEGDWAYPKNMWGGKDYGVNMLPTKGDMVWIEFENGNLSYPIWSHGGYALEEKPKEFDKANKYGFKTPRGTIILIDDQDEGKILVKYKSGKEYISLQTDLIELETHGMIKLGKNGDEFALMGNTTLEKINQLIDLISTHTHNLPDGTITLPPQQSPGFNALKSTMSEILSKKVKLDKSNPE